jgi:precorrin-2 methylase
MKNLFLSVIVTFFVTNSFATAINEDPKVVLVKTTKELSQLLNTRNHEGLLEANQMVKVLFTVNELHQVVVLQVNSKNPDLHYFVTNALNYKILKSMELKVGENYIVDIDFRI